MKAAHIGSEPVAVILHKTKASSIGWHSVFGQVDLRLKGLMAEVEVSFKGIVKG